MSDDEQRILAGYSAEMLQAGLAELTESVMTGRAGEWEKNRREMLHAEHQRRAAAKIDEPEKKAA